jgi:hypothetical protein
VRVKQERPAGSKRSSVCVITWHATIARSFPYVTAARVLLRYLCKGSKQSGIIFSLRILCCPSSHATSSASTPATRENIGTFPVFSSSGNLETTEPLDVSSRFNTVFLYVYAHCVRWHSMLCETSVVDAIGSRMHALSYARRIYWLLIATSLRDTLFQKLWFFYCLSLGYFE